MSKNTIKITTAHKQVMIDIDDLLYVVVQDRKSKLCFGNREPILTNLSIRKLLEMLPQDRFVLINKGVLISLAHLVEIDQLDYRMSDGTVLRARVKTSSQHNWQMRMRVLENQYTVQQEVYDIMLSDNIAIAVLQVAQKERKHAKVIYCNSVWDSIATIICSEGESKIADEAYDAMQTVAWQGGIRRVRGKYFSACFFRCDQGVCACVLRKLDGAE